MLPSLDQNYFILEQIYMTDQGLGEQHVQEQQKLKELDRGDELIVIYCIASKISSRIIAFTTSLEQ